MRLIQKFTAVAGLITGTFLAGRASADLTVAEGANNIIVETVAANAVNEAMLQLKVSNAAGQPAAEIRSIRVTAGGAGTANDLTDLVSDSVQLYRDVNGDGRVNLGGTTPDILLVSGNFSADGGFVDFTGLTEAVAANTSINLVVAYSLGAGASLGESFQTIIAANSHITAVRTDTQEAINVTGAPVNGFLRTVGGGKLTAQRIQQNPEGGIAIPNRPLLPVLSFRLTAQDVEDVNIASISFKDVGTSNAAALAKANTVRVFKQTTLPNDPVTALGAGTFTANDGLATVTFAAPVVIARNTNAQFWLTIDVAAENVAEIGKSLVFQLPATNGVEATGKYSLASLPIDGAPLTGPVWEYNYNPLNLTKAKDPLNAFMPSLAANYSAFSFSIQSDPVAKGEAVNITGMTFHASGTVNEATTITQAKLYKDLGTAARYDAQDVLLGTGLWDGDDGDLHILVDPANPIQISAGGTTAFILVYDLNGTAIDGQTHSVRFDTRADIESDGVVSLVAGNPAPLPFSSNPRTIGQPRATLTLDTNQKNIPSLIAPGATDFPILGFTIKADIDENLNFAGLILDLIGPLNESTFFTSFELWTDHGKAGVQDSDDIMLGTATPVTDNGGEGRLIIVIPDDQQTLIEKTSTDKFALYADVNPSVIGDGSETFSLVAANNDAVIVLGEVSRAQAKFTSAIPPLNLTRTIRNPAITVTRYPTTPGSYSVCVNGAYGMSGVVFSTPSSEDLIIERVEFTVSGTLDDTQFIAEGYAWNDENRNLEFDSGDGFPRFQAAPVKVDDGQGFVDMTENPIPVERADTGFPISIGVGFECADQNLAVQQLGRTVTMFTPPTIAVISGRGIRSGRPIEVSYPVGAGEGLSFTMDLGTLTVKQDAIQRTLAVPGGKKQEVYALEMKTSVIEGVRIGLTLRSLGTLDESRYIEPDYGVSVYFDGNRNGKIGDPEDYLCFKVNRPGVDNGPLVFNSSTAQYSISCDDVVYSYYDFGPLDQYLVTVDLTEDAPEGETLQFELTSTNDLTATGACSLAPYTVGAEITYPIAAPLLGSIVTVGRGRVEVTTNTSFTNDVDNKPSVVMAPGAVKYEVARMLFKATNVENQNLLGLTFKVSGTADDVAALAATSGVLLYKGNYTATTTPLATGVFDVDNGSVLLTTFTQPITLNSTNTTELRLALTGSGTAQPGQTMNLTLDKAGVNAVGSSSGLPISEIIPADPWVNIPIVFGPGRLTVRADEADTKILPLTVTGGAKIQALKFTASRTEQITLKDITVRAVGSSNELLALESGAVSLTRNTNPATIVGSAPFNMDNGEASLRSLDIVINADQAVTNLSLNSQLNLAGTIVGQTLRYDIEAPGKILGIGTTSGLPVQILLEDYAGGDTITEAESISGRTVTLSTGLVNLAAGTKNPANANITGVEQNLPLFQLKLTVDATLEAVQISEARFCPTGTADLLNVFTELRLYRDTDNDGRGTTNDVLLGTSQSIDIGGVPTIRFPNLNLPTLLTGSITNLLVVADLNPGVMQPGQTLRIGLCAAPTLTGLGQLTQQPINIQFTGQSPSGGTFSIPVATPTPTSTGGPSPTPTATPVNNGAVMLGDNFPASLDANASAAVQITVRNSGSSTWSPEAGYQLKIATDTCSLFDGAAALTMAPGASVAPNGDYVFTGQITADTLSTSCAVGLRMEHVGVGVFGQTLSRNVGINFVAPQITRQPASQAGNPGQNLLLACRASGSEPLSYQWFKDTQPIPDATSPDLPINGAAPGHSGIYRCAVTNPTGTVSSNSVTINVFGEAQANNAQPAGSSIPSNMLPDQLIQAAVTMRNISNVSWSATQGYNLRVIIDQAGLTQGLVSVPITDNLNVIPALNGTFSFPVTLRAPVASGAYSVTFQMAEGAAVFGEPFTATIGVGEVSITDLTSNPTGWASAVLFGGGAATAGPSGLCMDAPLTGNNVLIWVSPEGMLPLVDMRALRIRVTASTTQTQPDAVPLWDIVYDNFSSTGFGNSYGGEAIFLDQAGEANGIGRPGGRSQFEIWAMPVAARTLQWRGMLPNGQDNSNGAFVPFLDPYNDMRVIFRVLDLDAAGVLAEQDSGPVCISQINVQGFNLDALGGTFVWGPPLNNATHVAQNNGQLAEGAGVAVIDDASASAIYQLAPSGAGARKTMLPFDSALFDPNNPLAYAPLYPVLWESNRLYRGTLMIESGVEGGGEGVDPVDTIFVNFDAATNELVNIHVTMVGSPPDNFYRASSPRLASSTFGQPQPYSSFFYGHNTTLVDLQFVPNGNKFRPLGDFYNVSEINPSGAGGDRFIVRQMIVEQMTVPAP